MSAKVGDPSVLITVETDMFDHREVKPHFINPCCFGEDFATWLKERLSHSLDSGFDLLETIQEDYGWGFWTRHGPDRFWVAISYVGDGPREAPAQWVISVIYDPGWNLIKRLLHKPDSQTLQYLREQIKQTVTSNSAIRIVGTPTYDEG